MTRVSRVAKHLSEAQVKDKLKSAANFRQQQKWLVVYNALFDFSFPLKLEALAPNLPLETTDVERH